MNLSDKVAEILLGITITGLVSVIVWLFKWVDKVDLRLHDFDRDIKHVQRDYLGLSGNLARLDIEHEKIIASFRKALGSADRRMTRSESRIYVLEIRVNEGITQVLDRTKDTPFDSVKSS